MDVSSFLGGNFLTQLDLPQPSQVWTIRDVRQELVGTDQKIVVYFAEHQKGLGCNKVNLRAIATAYGTEHTVWIGKPLELYRDQTQFQGRTVPCVRVRIPQQGSQASQLPTYAAPAQPPAQLDQLTANMQPPVAAPQPQQPVVPPAPQQAPWERPPQQQQSPPSA